MRVLVTGGAGFIGSHLQEKLIELGKEVAVLDNFSTGKKEYLSPKAKFYKTDILDFGATKQAFLDFSPQVVFHLAAQISVPWSMEHPFEDKDINITGTMNVLEAAKVSGVQKVVYSNTGGAYYGEVPEGQMPIDEDHPILSPTSFYGVSKGCAETYLKLYGNIYGLGWVSLRYSNVYGPRQDGSKETGIVAIFTKKLLAGEQPTIFGDGTHARDYVFIEDVVAANMLALDYSKDDYFNIAACDWVTNNEVFAAIEAEVKSGIKVEYGPERPGDLYRIKLANLKAAKLLGWKPKVGFKEGVKRTIDYYRS